MFRFIYHIVFITLQRIIGNLTRFYESIDSRSSFNNWTGFNVLGKTWKGVGLIQFLRFFNRLLILSCHLLLENSHCDWVSCICPLSCKLRLIFQLNTSICRLSVHVRLFWGMEKLSRCNWPSRLLHIAIEWRFLIRISVWVKSSMFALSLNNISICSISSLIHAWCLWDRILLALFRKWLHVLIRSLKALRVQCTTLGVSLLLIWNVYIISSILTWRPVCNPMRLVQPVLFSILFWVQTPYCNFAQWINWFVWSQYHIINSTIFWNFLHFALKSCFKVHLGGFFHASYSKY